MKNFILSKYHIIKEWSLENITFEFLHHVNFGRWGAWILLLSIQTLPYAKWLVMVLSLIGIYVGTMIAAFAKEGWDYFDYKFFSWKDIKYTSYGMIEVYAIYLIYLIIQYYTA